ncbi:MAG TPA: FAD-dependent oxidoreductase [Drouetiella sp.]
MRSVAIVGTGIAGLSCAYWLREHANITIFEQNDYVGGHTNTIDVVEDGRALPIDTGFMVYNETTYPHLTKLFKELGITSKNTDMSFSVQNKNLDLEWSGTGFNRLFGQRKNIANIRFWRMLLELDRFNKTGMQVMNDQSIRELSLEQFIEREKFSADMVNLYLLPMMSALWSAPPLTMLQFPASVLLRFMFTHGLLSMYGKLQWLTLEGGARTYVQAMTKTFANQIQLNNKVTKVQRSPDGKLEVTCQNKSVTKFDLCILASHGDQSFELLDESFTEERNLLRNFKYQRNKVLVHTDSSVMPKNKVNWASWNYLIGDNKTAPTTTHYWMNSLQGVSDKVDYFVSLNSDALIDKSKIVREINYEHPIFTVDAMHAQKQLPLLNREANRTLFLCGSYFSHGFHEDAIASSYEVVNLIHGGVHGKPDLLSV